MLKDRKEYRKNYNAEGKLYIGGETLLLSCYDVSVKGAMVELTPGLMLAKAEDFNALLEEDNRAEIFIEDLLLSGEVVIAWVKQSRNSVLLGVEFSNVIPNSPKLWRKRRSYRNRQPFTADLTIDKEHLTVGGVNCSMEGACLQVAEGQAELKVDALVKLHINHYAINAIGKVVWTKPEREMLKFGVHYLPVK